MKYNELLNRIEDTKAEIEKAWETYVKLSENMSELCNELCGNISFEDLRPMEEKDLVVGKRTFGKYSKGFYTLVIDRVLEDCDLDFKFFEADGCRYGLFERYVLKD